MNQSELNGVMRENDVRHAQLWGAYNDLTQRRAKAVEIISTDTTNIEVSSMRVESAHMRQWVWYIITGLTLLLFSRFAFQSSKSSTSLFNTIVLTAIVVLFITVSSSRVTMFSSLWIPMLLPVIISIVVILYISHYIVHR